jgi:hypothetical protein
MDGDIRHVLRLFKNLTFDRISGYYGRGVRGVTLARRAEFAGQRIVALFHDTGDRYLSTAGLFD